MNALEEKDRAWLDTKFTSVHQRITDLRDEVHASHQQAGERIVALETRVANGIVSKEHCLETKRAREREMDSVRGGIRGVRNWLWALVVALVFLLFGVVVKIVTG